MYVFKHLTLEEYILIFLAQKVTVFVSVLEGNDNQECGHQTTPCQTISYAVKKCNTTLYENCSVLLKPGEYSSFNDTNCIIPNVDFTLASAGK